MKILLMEDDERIVSFLKRGLEAECHTIKVALNQEECLNVLTQCSIDVIIIDIFLGEYNGIDICQALRDLDNNVPIVMMTAKDAPENRAGCQRAGANAYLAKPFAFDDLLDLIQRLHVTHCSSSTHKSADMLVCLHNLNQFV